MARKIAVIGVGGIGLAVAERLSAAGFAVAGYRRGAMDDLLAAGGEAAASPAEAAAGAEAVFTCLPNAAAMTDVLDRDDGLVAALKPGQAVVDLTTMTPADKRACAGRIERAGAVMLDCPVSGTPGMIRAGRGAIFAAGPRERVEELRELLETAVGKASWVGPVGAGAAAKSVATMLVAIHNLAAAEGLALAAREGADIAAIHAAIVGSPADSAMFELRGALMAARDYSAGSGSLETFLRGLSAVAASVPAGSSPLLQTTCDVYRAAVDAGFTGRDHASVFEYLVAGIEAEAGH